MGLGVITESGTIFLAIQGGLVWDKKADSNHAYYREQPFKTQSDPEGSMTGLRKGAAYADITGTIVKVEFQDHDKYGESIAVTMDDSEGNRYVVTASTNNRFGQDIEKALLTADLTLPVKIKPYAFPDKENKSKIVTGCNIFNDGQKLDLKPENMPQAPEGFFKTASMKQKQKFFLELSEWFRGEIEETVIPTFKPLVKKEGKPAEKTPANNPAPANTGNEVEEVEETNEAPEETTTKVAEVKPPSPIQMKKEIQAYSNENYEGRKIPVLAGDELKAWYKAVISEDELPWDDDEQEVDASNVPESDINAQLDALK